MLDQPTIEDLQAILRDHINYSKPVCVHPDPDDPPHALPTNRGGGMLRAGGEGQMPTPLLTAKLFISVLRPELVQRQRLVERLDAGLYPRRGVHSRTQAVSKARSLGILASI